MFIIFSKYVQDVFIVCLRCERRLENYDYKHWHFRPRWTAVATLISEWLARAEVLLSRLKSENENKIELSLKSRPHSTYMKQPSPFNTIWKSRPVQPIWKVVPIQSMWKAVLIQFIWKAVPIQHIWKSRSHSNRRKKPFSFNTYEKAISEHLKPSRR